MATAKKAKVDPKLLEESQNTWDAFVKLTKYSIYAVIAILVLMALALL